MDKLPLEIISIIIAHLGNKTPGTHYVEGRAGIPHGYRDRIYKNSLAQYATISKRSQQLVEAATFRHILLLTPTRLETALHVMTPSRLRHLRFVKVDCIFNVDDPTDLTATCESDNTDSLHERAGHIIQSLFRLLEATPLAAKPLVTVHLSIPLPSHAIKANTRICLGDELFEKSWYVASRTDRYLVAVGGKSVTYLKLAQEIYHELPDLPMVSGFMLSLKARSLAFEPRSICLIASRMSRLEKVEWELSDAEKRDPELRIRQRDGFAENIGKLPMSVKNLTVRYSRVTPRDESFEPPSIIPAGHADHLSKALRQLSLRPNLVKFSFDGSVDSEILWPSKIDGDKPPHWPSMREFTIDMATVLPSGKWAAFPDPNDDGESSLDTVQPPDTVPGEEGLNRVRRLTDAQIFDEVCLAAGKAAGQMPSLEHLYVSFGGGDVESCKLVETDLSYELQRVLRSQQKDPLLSIRAEPVLEPSEETIEVWREASAKHGVGFWMRLENSDASKEEDTRDVR